MRLTRRQMRGNTDRGLPQVTCLRFTERQLWWYTMEECPSMTCSNVMPRSLWKPSPIFRQRLAKAGPSVTVLLTWHCVFEDKDNCVKFLLRTQHWLRRTATEAFRILLVPATRINCSRWWVLFHINLLRLTHITNSQSNVSDPFKFPL